LGRGYGRGQGAASAWKRVRAVYLGPSSAQGEFCSQGVREGLIVGFIRSVCQTAQSFCDSPGEKGGATPPALLLLLSRLCLDYETATISYILTLTDEQFLVQVNWLICGAEGTRLGTQETG
jgi:hypothetical protein